MALKLTLVTAPSPILCQSSRFAELKRWQPLLFMLFRTTISTTGSYAPTLAGNFRHYATRESAERVAQAIAQERDAELVVHLPDGMTRRTRFAKSRAARLFRR
jgi:predicted aminopeptidase